MTAFESIRDRVPQTELLAQLAEEASELAHAALKLRRAYDGTNPTPVPAAEALSNLKEEIADVQLLVSVLGLNSLVCANERACIMEAKLKRWLDRLGVDL